jgi:hypothetical protein
MRFLKSHFLIFLEYKMALLDTRKFEDYADEQRARFLSKGPKGLALADSRFIVRNQRRISRLSPDAKSRMLAKLPAMRGKLCGFSCRPQM